MSSRDGAGAGDGGPGLITVLVPCRDANVAFLHEAIQSALAQDFPHWELVLVDDHSDDPATLEALEELSGVDARVSVVESAGRMVTGALNTGMDRARTPFVCALHCDDLLEPRALGVLNRAIEAQPEVDYFHSSRRFIDEDGRALSSVYPARESFALEDFVRGCPVKSLHCWRVAAATAIGGMDEGLGLHGADDYDFPWRMAEAGFTFRAIPDCLYAIRDHRAHFRLTTHVPLDHQVAELVTMLRKHGVDEPRVREEVERRKGDYLRQALYASEEDRLEKERQGFDAAKDAWRVAYR
jgi:glycosyltransferase involved in cell wall biosynthesis